MQNYKLLLMLHTGWLQEDPGQVTQCICFQGAEHGLLDCRSLVEEEAVDVNLRDAWDAMPLYYACRSGKRFARHCQVNIGIHDDYAQSRKTQIAELCSQQAVVDDSLDFFASSLHFVTTSSQVR